MNEMVRDMLAKRRDRAIAIILGTKEREIDPHVPLEARQAFRKVVLDQVNDFCDFALDVLRSIDDDSVVLNRVYLQKIDKIHEWLADGDSFPELYDEDEPG